MKQQLMEYSRLPLRWLSNLILVPAVFLFFVLFAQAQTAILPPVGGNGGRQFIARCPLDQLLTGFELRAGDDIDAIRVICVTAYGPKDVGPLVLGGISFGGNGGSPAQLVCPGDQPIITGMEIEAEGVDTITVNNIHLYCGLAAAAQTPSELPSAVFDAPNYKASDGWLGIGISGQDATHSYDLQRCPAGLVAVGINGRSGDWLDSVGLICAPPQITSKAAVPSQVAGPVKSLGRVEVSPPTVEYSGNAKETNPYSALKDPATPAPSAPMDVSQQNDLATKGEVVANEDPLSVELRNREAEGPPRRGFDIGMAAAEGQTAPGPGKQRIHDSLSPDEQKGFETAVSFSLERNRNADFATTGAAIANRDPIVAQARTAETDVFYWLGFDIATGIFGDPALGARGNTATGPGSLKIRDSLSAPGQRGFNASVALHLSRNYKS